MDRMTYICSDAYSSFLRNESNAYVGVIEAGFSWQGQEEDLRGQLLARLSFRGGRKCSRKKLWRPDVSGVGGGARDFFRKLTVNDRVNLRSECGGTIPFDRCASYVAPPLKERKNGNLNDLRHARLSRILIGGEDKGESCTKS